MICFTRVIIGFILASVGFTSHQVLAEHEPRFLGEQVSLDEMLETLKVLTGESAIDGGRFLSNRFSEGNRQLVRNFLANKLTGLGYEVWKESTWVEGVSVVNIVAQKMKNDMRPAVEVVTHYDSAGVDVTGADDNGSGVAAGVEIARVLKDSSSQYPLRFVFTDLEERGFIGSSFHVELLKRREKSQLHKAFVLDMLGSHGAGRQQRLDFVFGETPGAHDWGNRILAQQLRYNDRDQKLFMQEHYGNPHMGDHGPYWFSGLDAVFVRESYETFSPYYHTPQDTIQNMNLDYYLKSVSTVLEHIANEAQAEIPVGLRAKYLSRVEHYNRLINKEFDSTTDFLAEIKPLQQFFWRLIRLEKIPTLKRLWKRVSTMIGARYFGQASAEEQFRTAFLAEAQQLKLNIETTIQSSESETVIRTRVEQLLEAFGRKYDLDMTNRSLCQQLLEMK